VNSSDYIIVGGGLQGGLIALALRHRQPAARVTMIDRGPRPGGNHTWSFHANDLPTEAEPFVRPLVSAEWPNYLVNFPGFARTVPSRYAAISSDRFADVMEKSGCELRTGTEVVALGQSSVRLADGTELNAACVLDCRGPNAVEPTTATGYQKFVGLEIETERHWPDAVPTIMDASVPQDDGFRFVYVLPFTSNRVLIEETHFADGTGLNKPLLRQRIGEYADARNVGRWRVLREEAGVLPMPWAGAGVRVPETGPLPVGYAGGWCHPATGYSFPLAVRVALAIMGARPSDARTAIRRLARRIVHRQRFARFLNRLLFTLVVPQQRWQVFRRLYRAVPDATLNRFYALDFGPLDAARMVVGWPPPVSLSRLIHRPEPTPCPLPST
jgi:lycopene beta-cyclase